MRNRRPERERRWLLARVTGRTRATRAVGDRTTLARIAPRPTAVTRRVRPRSAARAQTSRAWPPARPPTRGCSNANPAAVGRCGTARVPASSRWFAAWPSAMRSAGRGAGKSAGRCIVRASARVQSRLMTGSRSAHVDRALTSRASTNSTARASSSSDTHGIHRRPFPSRPPRPYRSGLRPRPRAGSPIPRVASDP